MSPFKEAHQFKGVFPDPVLVAAADKPGIDAETAAKLRARPPFTRDVSLHFSDGKFFDVQEDTSGQYLVLDRPPGAPQPPRAYVGDWIVQMHDGSFKVLSDDLYAAVTGTEK